MRAGWDRPERLQIMLSEEELGLIDDWRFNRRMPSRAAAVRELLRRGLETDQLQRDDASKRPSPFV